MNQLILDRNQKGHGVYGLPALLAHLEELSPNIQQPLRNFIVYMEGDERGQRPRDHFVISMNQIHSYVVAQGLDETLHLTSTGK